ncbi:MATE family efflux transporter [Eubacteriales bacterium OttesenSCG-928-N13]|nr:MATE family efflux transporter [Eubacteriales bacterium OttesenSCG-928-N13]
MKNSLNMKITPVSLLKYALPTILSTVFMNVYSLVDSLFVSNLIDTDALSAVNIVGPLLAITLAIGTMIAAGGSALIAKQLGEEKDLESKQNFSFFLVFCVMVSVIFAVVGLIFRQPILYAMGADAALYPTCEAYAIPLMFVIPFAMIGMLVQMFFVTAGKPGLGFGLSLIGGVLNIIFDYVLIAVIPLGVAGAAYATGIGYVFQSIAGLAYFIFKRNGSLSLVKPKWNGRALLKACGNGMSEMVGMLSISVTMVAMNIILMQKAGSDGVAAGAIVLSAQTILSAVYMGYTMGIAPVISFNYGGQNNENLQKIYKIALRTIGIMSVFTCIAMFPAARPIARLYAEGVENVIEMAVNGMYIFSVAFLFMGFNLFASSMFTAFNDGRTSAMLSLFRTLIFLIIPLLILPPMLGVLGVWIALPMAEVLSIIMSVYYFKKKKSVYHYA